VFRFAFRRLALIVPTLIAMSLITFFLVRVLPGDPVEIRLGERPADAAQYAALRHELGLDRPLLLQYGTYLLDMLQGDFGRSISTHEPVLREFRKVLPATVELAACAIVLALVAGIGLGVIAALRRGTGTDHGVMAVALGGYSMPIFWWALLLILVFSVHLGWTPVSGRIDVAFDVPPVTGFMLIDTLISGEPGAFVSALRHLILPTIVLATMPLAVIARMTRSSMLEVLNEDYVRTARAKGLSPWRVVLIHALRNALIPVITVTGLQVGTLLAGAIVTETIFSWPGLGRWLIEALRRRDYPVLQAGVFFVSCMTVLVNLGVDLLYGIANPRLRSSR
jgi:dipeptide transport system permease protein